MKKIALVAGLVLAASVAVAPLAFAQDDDAPSCAEAIVALNTAQEAYDAAVAADQAADEATDADDALLAAAAVVVPESATTDTGTIAAEDVTAQNRADIAAALAVSIAADNNPQLPTDSALTVALKAALAAADNALALQAEAAGDAPALRAVAAETDAVELESALATAQAVADEACRGPQGEPGFVDLDCRDFPLPDGRTAQSVLDADAADPHNLDLDGDRVACEIDETIDDGNDSDTGGDFDQVGELPTAIDTGRA